MAVTTVVSTGTVPDGPGLSQQSHIFFDTVTGYWWAFTYKSASTTTLYAYYTTDTTGLTGWTTPTNPTVTLLRANNGASLQMGLSYKSISGHAVVAFNIVSIVSGTAYQDYVYCTLSGTTCTWTSVTNYDSNTGSLSASSPIGFVSGNYVVASDSSNNGVYGVYLSSTSAADTGTSHPALTSGITNQPSGFTATGIVAQCIIPLSTGNNFLFLCDNGTPNNVLWGKETYNTLSGAAANVFGSNQSMNYNDWGACYVDDTHIHCVRYNGSSSWTHEIYNGTSFGAGGTIGSQAAVSGSGVALISDGTNVWLLSIDSSNNINYCKYSSGSWGSWTQLTAGAGNTRKYVTAAYGSTPATITVAWSEASGSNYNFNVTPLSTAGVAFTWQQLTQDQVPADYFARPEVASY